MARVSTADRASQALDEGKKEIRARVSAPQPTLWTPSPQRHRLPGERPSHRPTGQALCVWPRLWEGRDTPDSRSRQIWIDLCRCAPAGWNDHSAAATSLQPAGSPLGPSTYCWGRAPFILAPVPIR